ncbi:hypothetical protein EN836_25250 [Mesorhizobium sp. M1C.F.Ca.ET.193.01.1.1]|nr:hypothetical protein EN853_25240 [Mesorhizobium sp. M1C.F.Ca.ET.210.01.1.1]TGQ67114.1 hypothetical protein EN855_025250 [Mesorhizobium sp. M1C.F.Ca.ET.212.01.1.1]TGR01610.1 hypothetical protein EN847_25240 [Mesorhizobium sp. M1C.F.Ca.ET.204.01.1.1]TGR22173.1 hypothetical protein EN839_25240 [Mesorhizobium sp. M1C.F.Ca.ET.196.01.1.1]TGR44880.1 hypothetical protein EN838_25240 [Mesorhizobium sp. M1C.F.Ca.ET.195.01.1.1]TGR62318.1 hypothetical protein EN835_025235 [Mesorhizobium sp. M1C.F.Ca.ET
MKRQLLLLPYSPTPLLPYSPTPLLPYSPTLLFPQSAIELSTGSSYKAARNGHGPGCWGVAKR